MNLYSILYVTQPVTNSPYTSFVIAADIEDAMAVLKKDEAIPVDKFIEIKLIFDDIDHAIGWPGND